MWSIISLGQPLIPLAPAAIDREVSIYLSGLNKAVRYLWVKENIIVMRSGEDN